MLYKGTLGIPECPWSVKPGEVAAIPIRLQEVRELSRELHRRPPPPPVPTVEQLRAMTLAELDAYVIAAANIREEAWRMFCQRRDEETTRHVAKLDADRAAAKIERETRWAENRARKSAAKALRDAKRRKSRVLLFGSALTSPGS